MDADAGRQFLPDETKVLNARADTMSDPSRTQSAVATDYLKRDQQEDARVGFYRALDWDPWNVDALLGLAMLRAGIKDAESATALARKAEKEGAKDPKTEALMGVGLLRVGQTEKAAKRIERALQRNPKDFSLLLSAAVCQARLKHWSQAEAYCRRAAAVVPESESVEPVGANPYPGALAPHLLLGTLYLQQGKAAQAAAVGRSLLLQHPDDPKDPRVAAAHQLVARALWAQGQPKQALAQLDKAQGLQPRWLDPYVDGGSICLQTKAYDEAIQRYRVALALSPRCLPAAMGGAEAYLAKGNLESAIVAYERVLQIAPQHVAALNNLAYLCAQTGIRLDRAVKIADALAKSNPKSAAVQDTIGWIYYRAGRSKDALKHLEKAVGLDPKNGVACYHRGLALAALGRSDEARQDLHKALSLGMPAVETKEAKAHLAKL